MENKTLLRPLVETARKELAEYEDFISRRDFINQTGIYVTPEYFDYIYECAFKESGVTAEEFVKDYEEKYSTCIVKTELTGTLKYEYDNDYVSCMGEYDEDHEPNAWEIIDCLARELSLETQRKEDLVERYKHVIENIMETNRKLVEMLKPENVSMLRRIK